MLERVTSTKNPFNMQAPVQPTPAVQLSPLAADIHGLASSIGVLAGKVAVDEWEYLSILRRNLRAAADQVAERERWLEMPCRTRTDYPAMVYVAAPYSHPDVYVRASRARFASECSAWFMEAGFSVVSPLSMGHHIAEKCVGVRTDFAAWENTCLQLLESCSRLCVLMLEGVQNSVGVAAEIAHARNLRIPCEQMRFVNGQFKIVQNPEWW